VRRIGGKVDAYRKQLRRFREHYSDAATSCSGWRLSDVQQAEEYCHALKGVTAVSVRGPVWKSGRDRCPAEAGALRSG
jgi:hypothetical protein